MFAARACLCLVAFGKDSIFNLLLIVKSKRVNENPSTIFVLVARDSVAVLRYSVNKIPSIIVCLIVKRVKMEANVRRGANGKIRVPVAEFGAKYQNKNECYQFLVHDVGAYCAPRDCMTIWHLRDMATGAKGHIKAADIQHLHVPHFDSLSVERMLTWANAYHAETIARYLPYEREIPKLPRQVRTLSSFQAKLW